MKSDINQIKNTLDKKMNFLQKIYGVETIGVFGSVATGQNTKSSDIDLLVEFRKPIGFFKFIELEDFLSKILGSKVDLVTKKALKPIIKEEVLREVVYV